MGPATLQAGADRADGVIHAARGEHERARTLLEDAVDGFERTGTPYEAALARRELARVPRRVLGRGLMRRRGERGARERSTAELHGLGASAPPAAALGA